MQCVKSSNCHMRAGSLVALSIIAEGTIRCIREHLHKLMPVVIAALKDRVSNVRRGACVCLGQWIEHMGAVGMIEHHSSVLPPILIWSVIMIRVFKRLRAVGRICGSRDLAVRPYFKPLMNQMSHASKWSTPASSDGIFCNRCVCCGPETRVPTSFWTDHCRRETSDEFRCGQVKEIACSTIFGMLWSNRSAVGPELFRLIFRTAWDSQHWQRKRTTRSFTIRVAFFSICVCFGKEFASLHSNSCRIPPSRSSYWHLAREVSQDAGLGAGFAGFEDEEENDDTNLKLSVSTGNADKKVSASLFGCRADYAPAVYAANPTVAKEAVINFVRCWTIGISRFDVQRSNSLKLFIAIGGGDLLGSDKKIPFVLDWESSWMTQSESYSEFRTRHGDERCNSKLWSHTRSYERVWCWIFGTVYQTTSWPDLSSGTRRKHNVSVRVWRGRWWGFYVEQAESLLGQRLTCSVQSHKLADHLSSLTFVLWQIRWCRI